MRTAFTISPFQGLVSWRCHFIPLHGMLADYALSGLFGLLSPEGATYTNEAVSPSDRQIPHCPILADYALSGLFGLLSPEGATYMNDGGNPSDTQTPQITSPEGETYTTDGHRPSSKTSSITIPEGA